MKETYYFKQAELVLRILPFIYKSNKLGLKGGTAINYFERNLPRLSVDIDLTYLHDAKHKNALLDITNILNQLSEDLSSKIPGVAIIPKRLKDGTISTLFAAYNHIQIKIEVNPVLRGTIHPCREMRLCPSGQTNFQIAPKARVLSIPDLYGGKICATLDRQHPRDLFDVKLLFENEGLTEEIRKAFIVYLISHSRPISELLNPNFKDIRSIFENEFQGMTFQHITLDALLKTRKELVDSIHRDLTNDEKHFLLSVKMCKPHWELLRLDGIERLPAIHWKLQNLRQMNRKKHLEAIEKLKQCLNL